MEELIITSERQILLSYIKQGKDFPTKVRSLREAKYPNPRGQEELGQYRDPRRQKSVIADMEVIQDLIQEKKPIPGFLEAGPRQMLAFNDRPSTPDSEVRAAVVTAGGLAPGLNSVVHTIVERHLRTYHMLSGSEGGVWGVYDSFKGLSGDPSKWEPLTLEKTEKWLERGGCELGAIRYTDLSLEKLVTEINRNLDRWSADILYIIGGDGSLTTAHEIAIRTRKTIVVGIPKTMDNDILWVWQSFGFNTAVERAASFINTMHTEAESTRRVCILELFGARAGYVAANAALASGHVDLVMIPEVFKGMKRDQAEQALQKYTAHLDKTIGRKGKKPHAVIVLAEGVGELLSSCGAEINGKKTEAKKFPEQLRGHLYGKLIDITGRPVDIFVVQPSYYIRAIPANSHDQIYCKRLGTLAVDNALAGYTDFMISQWLTEYVLVPLQLVARGQKRIPPGGMFWKQVVASTRQPIIFQKKLTQEPNEKLRNVAPLKSQNIADN